MTKLYQIYLDLAISLSFPHTTPFVISAQTGIQENSHSNCHRNGLPLYFLVVSLVILELAIRLIKPLHWTPLSRGWPTTVNWRYTMVGKNSTTFIDYLIATKSLPPRARARTEMESRPSLFPWISPPIESQDFFYKEFAMFYRGSNFYGG